MGIRRIYRKTTLQFLKLLSFAISAIFGLLFNCSSNSSISTPEYGMPHADYKISGTVKSFDDYLPVRRLLVCIRDTNTLSIMDDSTMTDSLGKYALEFSCYPLGESETLILQVKDVDSTVNGFFTTKDTSISFSRKDLKGGDGKWYNGHTEKKVDFKVDWSK